MFLWLNRNRMRMWFPVSASNCTSFSTMFKSNLKKCAPMKGYNFANHKSKSILDCQVRRWLNEYKRNIFTVARKLTSVLSYPVPSEIPVKIFLIGGLCTNMYNKHVIDVDWGKKNCEDIAKALMRSQHKNNRYLAIYPALPESTLNCPKWENLWCPNCEVVRFVGLGQVARRWEIRYVAAVCSALMPYICDP